jgi:hypothetical protein
MPKLPNQWIKARASDQTELICQCSCSVDSQGLFAITIDTKFEESAYLLAKQYSTWPGIKVEYFRDTKRAYGKSLEQLVRFCNAAALDSITGTETKERIIGYQILTEVAFWVNHKDGTIHPSGGSPEAGDGKWWTAKVNASRLDSRSSSPFFSVGVAAAVFDKITTIRSTGTTERYELVRAEHCNDEQPRKSLGKTEFVWRWH